MEKRVALIVGGSSGIGAYIVEQFVAVGYITAFTYCHNAEKATALAARTNAKAYQLDVTNEKNVADIRDKLAEEYGHLDAVIYASGIFEDALVENMSLDSWDRVLVTNLTGAFLVAKYMLSMLRDSGNGRFICTGSVMGESGIYGSCSYAASKAGLIGLVKSIALENARYNVTANVVSFGYIDTGMTKLLSEKVLESATKKIPMKKLGDPVDTAKVIVDLCAAETNYISGQVIRINGLLYV